MIQWQSQLQNIERIRIGFIKTFFWYFNLIQYSGITSMSTYIEQPILEHI